MATIATVPVRAVGHALKAAGSIFTSFGKKGLRGITLIPQYLAGLLWIISQQFLDLARNSYAGNSAVYAVLRVLSTAIPEPPLIAYRAAANPASDPIPLPADHPLVRLIQSPNELMSEYEMWEIWTLQLATVGRAVFWKERNQLGEIIALWPLRPDRVGPIYSTSAQSGQHVITGWSYLVPGSVEYLPIARSDIWLTNLADPAGESGGLVEGLGPLQVLAAEVGADNEATRFVGALLANGAQPGLVVTTQASLTTQADVDRVKAAARQEFGGMRRGSVAVLDGSSTLTQTGFNMQQLEFPNLRKVAESRISAALGVPAILAGLQVGLEAGIRATIAEQREYFAETTCSGYWRRGQDSFERDVAAEFEDGLVCLFDMRKVKALAEQSKNEIDKIAQGFHDGAVCYDEYRTKVLGLPPLGAAAGGLRRVLPRGSVEVDENGNVVEISGVPVTGMASLLTQQAEQQFTAGQAPPPQPPPALVNNKKPKGAQAQEEAA